MSENAAWAFALYDYDAVEAGDLKFRAGDLLHIVSLPSMNVDFNWIVAENPRTGDQGEVPSNYITRECGYSATLDAFRDTDRSGANSLLQSPSYLSNFNYIVRPSRDNDGMALSVRTAKGCVTHYKIYFNPQDKSCRLFPSESFDTIEDLVIHYMENEIQQGVKLQAYKPFKDSMPPIS
ncbi:unnamed protein product [Hydatigera taeniaeformis]|uniref:SH2 domain-containing protein n=1 Tax=Hydatigena taeniaeformis TaxID=6205 RepID=A0A0R3WT30_HYDTA|nr:unnamed protein product [Hydatigera taeniaeformis]